jgi:hypothetical protein
VRRAATNGAKIRLISFLIVILILIIIVANEAIMIRSKIMMRMALVFILAPFRAATERYLRSLGMREVAVATLAATVYEPSPLQVTNELSYLL